MKASTGLRNKLLDTGSLKVIMALGFLKLYSGTVPALADDSLGAAVLLCTVSVASGGGGLSLGTAASGAVPKASETWSGTNVASGTCTFFRYVAVGDDGASSTTQARIQGVVGSDLALDNSVLTISATTTISSFAANLPTL